MLWAPSRARSVLGCAVLAATMLLTGCVSAGPTPLPSSTEAPSVSPTPVLPPPPSADPIARLSLAQRVGQLFMVGSPASVASPVTLDAVTTLHVGNVFLGGRSEAGVAATAAVAAQFRERVTSVSTGGIELFVATDQEGGYVQVLQGPGFSAMPTALAQAGLDPAVLLADASGWGEELAAAGITMNLAPVVDLITSPTQARNNAPIGYQHRQYGYDAATVQSHAGAFRKGVERAGVAAVIKHFPGLGDVTRNTDTASGVTDVVTTAGSASVAAFAAQIDAGARAVMMSSAIYTQLDAGAPAVFSPAIVTGLLRGELGFDGVVITDDVSAARQVTGWSPADRAILAIEAGVDIVLVSADPTVAAEMVAAVMAKARTDYDFAVLVDAAARRVLTLKG